MLSVTDPNYLNSDQDPRIFYTPDPELKSFKEINKKYRNKDRPTNILSFALRKDEGELILCPAVIKREAPKHDKTFKEFLGFLVIHGMLHLKGLDHGKKMEKLEEKYLSRTKFFLK